MATKEKLSIDTLILEAKDFCNNESYIPNSDLFGITDGKAVGTYIEHKFKAILKKKYDISIGSSALGIDLPSEDILTDIKVTSIKQPQSSCPFKDVKQKIYGLGYNLLLFVYDKQDNHESQTTKLIFVSCNYISKELTADYTTTYRLRQMVQDNAIQEDIIAYLRDRNLPADDITLDELSQHILSNIPKQGYLTISNALQWRLQYSRVVNLTDDIDGITRIIKF